MARAPDRALPERRAERADRAADPGWEVELLRASDGVRPLRELLGKIPVPVPTKLLREQLYLLYLLNVINPLLPAGGSVNSP